MHAQIATEVKTAVKVNVYATTRQIVDPVFAEHFEQDHERDFPVLANVYKVAQRARAKAFPKNPLNMEFDWGKNDQFSNLFSKKIILPCFLFYIALFLPHLPESFFREDVIVKTKNTLGRHLIFASDKQIKLLKKAQRWYVDGTFFVAPNLFYQLYIVHSFIRHGELEKQVKKVQIHNHDWNTLLYFYQ